MSGESAQLIKAVHDDLSKFIVPVTSDLQSRLDDKEREELELSRLEAHTRSLRITSATDATANALTEASRPDDATMSKIIEDKVATEMKDMKQRYDKLLREVKRQAGKNSSGGRTSATTEPMDIEPGDDSSNKSDANKSKSRKRVSFKHPNNKKKSAKKHKGNAHKGAPNKNNAKHQRSRQNQGGTRKGGRGGSRARK